MQSSMNTVNVKQAWKKQLQGLDILKFKIWSFQTWSFYWTKHFASHNHHISLSLHTFSSENISPNFQLSISATKHILSTSHIEYINGTHSRKNGTEVTVLHLEQAAPTSGGEMKMFSFSFHLCRNVCKCTKCNSLYCYAFKSR